MYAADFLADENVIAMELDEVGAFQILLCIHWREDSIPENHERIARLLRVDVATVDRIWPALAPCFVPARGKTGRLINKRLDRERKALDSYHKERRKSGKKGADARWGKDSKDNESDGSAMAKGMAKNSPSPSPSPSPAITTKTDDVPSSDAGRVVTWRTKGHEDLVFDLSAEALRKDKGAIGARYLPACRKHMWPDDGKPPEGWTEKQEISKLFQLLKTVRPDQLDLAIKGISRLRAQGEIEYILNGKKKLTSRVFTVGFEGMRLLEMSAHTELKGDPPKQGGDGLGRLEA